MKSLGLLLIILAVVSTDNFLQDVDEEAIINEINSAQDLWLVTKFILIFVIIIIYLL